MAKPKKIDEKDKPIGERWQDYGVALLTWIIIIFLWIFVGSMALWGFQNKSTEMSLPSDLTKLPYMNSKGFGSSGPSVFDLPLFTYKSPVGFPYFLKEQDDTMWAGFGNWFSRTEIGAWAFPRKALQEVGKIIALSFKLLEKIPDIPGVKVNYYNIAELAAVFILPIFVIIAFAGGQPLATGLATLVSAFYNNSWFWGCIGLLLPIWLMTTFNITLQSLYLSGWLTWMPLFSGGLGFMAKIMNKNKMPLLWLLCLVAIIISTSYLPSAVTVGMVMGFLLIAAWHYFFGPMTNKALSKLGSSDGKSKSKNKSKSSKSSNGSNGDSNSTVSYGSGNNSNSNNSNSNNSIGNNSGRNTSNTRHKLSMKNVPPSQLAKILMKSKNRE
jgi:hypothetical protein